MKTQLKIEGMSCQHCVRAVAEVINQAAGVEASEVTVGEATITHPDNLDWTAILANLEEEGFKATVSSTTS